MLVLINEKSFYNCLNITNHLQFINIKENQLTNHKLIIKIIIENNKVLEKKTDKKTFIFI